MNAFDFVTPRTVAEAIAAGAEPGAAFLAGGTNLVDLMKMGVSRPARLVHIGRLAGLDRIETLADGGLEDRRAGPQCGPGAATRALRRFPAHRRGDAVGRVGAIAQRRDASAAISCSARAALISSTPPAPATSASRAQGCDAQRRRCARRRRSRRERGLRRDTSVRSLRRAGCARCDRRDRRAGGTARDRARRLSSLARRRAGARDEPGSPAN